MRDIIVNYWSQVAIILAAIGYVCKVFLDSGFKRKEIGYSIYAKERLSAIANFLSTYEKAQSDIRVSVTIIHWNLNKGKGLREDIIDFKPTLNLLRDQMRHSRLFLSTDEFDLFHDATANLDLVDSGILLLEGKLKDYNLPIEEAMAKWKEECESMLNEDESKLEKFIDDLGKKYNRRFW